MYIHTYIYICIHTYIHTHTPSCPPRPWPSSPPPPSPSAPSPGANDNTNDDANNVNIDNNIDNTMNDDNNDNTNINNSSNSILHLRLLLRPQAKITLEGNRHLHELFAPCEHSYVIMLRPRRNHARLQIFLRMLNLGLLALSLQN